ncbi:MAG: hypothetical protein RMY29_004290 [Nostoc sp. CreGUA01]
MWGERELMLPHPPTPPTPAACPMPKKKIFAVWAFFYYSWA